MKKYFLLTALFLITVLSHAKVSLPVIFSDHMVLQRNSQVAVWGKADPGEHITVKGSWGKEKVKTITDTKGEWKVKISTPEAGGPYTLIVEGKNKIIFSNVMSGEVWLCSGQSNMEFRVKGSFSQPNQHYQETIAEGKKRKLRFFTVNRSADLMPKDDCKGTWTEANVESIAGFSAVAYYFGSLITDLTDVPVGLINTSYGGSIIECWMSRDLLSEFKGVKLPDFDSKITNAPGTPTVLYNGMLRPVIGYGIRGAIWYQGESNRNDPEMYAKLLPAMVSEWRKQWGVGEFPFYYAQIAPFGYLLSGRKGQSSAAIRETQLESMNTIPNSGMAVLTDIGEEDCIHPANKKAAGQRLAYWALAREYAVKGIDYRSPEFKSMEVKNGKALISFNYAPNGISSFGKEIKEFELAGADSIFYPAKASVIKNLAQVECFSPQVPEPVYVRYAFNDYTTGSLFSTSGLPVSSFRSDRFPLPVVK